MNRKNASIVALNLVILFCTLLFTVFSVRAQPGILDVFFNSTGFSVNQFGTGDSEAAAIVLQPDGKHIISGSRTFGNERTILIARFNPDGSLDPTFGTGGTVGINIPFGNFDLAYDVKLQTDGKVVVCGYSSESPVFTEQIFVVARLTSAGILDSTFDGDGIFTTHFPGGVVDIAAKLAIQSDGKIVVAGINNSDFGVLRLLTDGTLDTSFDVDGFTSVDFNLNQDRAFAVALQSDGKIVVAGETHSSGVPIVGVARLDASGQLDPTFGFMGRVTAGGNFSNANDVVVQSDGKIVIAGRTSGGSFSDFLVIRFNNNGSHEGFFQGAIGTGSDIARSIAIQPDGKILVAGESDLTSQGGEDFAAFRLNANSDGGGFLTLDTTFSGDGKVRTDLGSGEKAYAIALKPDGSMLLAGRMLLASVLTAFVKYAEDGSIDDSFDDDGRLTVGLGSAESAFRSVAVQADGKYVLTGFAKVNTTVDAIVARFNPSGTLDTTFDGDGIAITDFSNRNDIGRTVLIQTDGKIVIAVESGTAMSVARYNTDGTLDTSFSGDGKVEFTFFGTDTQGSFGAALQPDGKIVVTGTAKPSAFANRDIRTFRLNTDGTQDGSSVGTDIGGGDDVGRAVAIQADGKILVASNGIEDTNQDFVVVRYNSNLTIDTTFSGDGMAFIDFGPGNDLANALAVQSDGKILAAGSASNGTNLDLGLVRLNVNGSRDTTFSGDGRVMISASATNDVANAVLVQPSGKIIVGGTAGTMNANVVTARLLTNGTLDSSSLWGTGGVALSDFGGNDALFGMSMGENDKLVIAGSSGGSTAVARLFGDLGPTAASASIRGRVLTASGAGIRKVRVTLVDQQGNTLTASTGTFGYYRFDGVEVGQTYVLSAFSKQFQFALPNRVITLTDELTDIDFVAQ